MFKNVHFSRKITKNKMTKNVHFSFDNNIYIQNDGIAMESPLGPILHTFQLSRFEQETPVWRGCLPSSRLISKSPVLREASANFQFFLKIPICIASYFVFWCFNCVTAIGNVKNAL